MGLKNEALWSDSWQGKEVFLFSKLSLPILEANKPPQQLAPRTFSQAVKLLGSESDHSSLSSPEVKNDYSYKLTPSRADTVCTEPISFNLRTRHVTENPLSTGYQFLKIATRMPSFGPPFILCTPVPFSYYHRCY